MKDSLCDEFCNKNKTKKRGIDPLFFVSHKPSFLRGAVKLVH